MTLLLLELSVLVLRACLLTSLSSCLSFLNPLPFNLSTTMGCRSIFLQRSASETAAAHLGKSSIMETNTYLQVLTGSVPCMFSPPSPISPEVLKGFWGRRGNKVIVSLACVREVEIPETLVFPRLFHITACIQHLKKT